MPLNPRQLRFVDAYLGGAAASAAYRAAGYACRTDRAAEATASALLRHPAVAAAVEAGRQAATASAGVNAGRVVRGCWPRPRTAGRAARTRPGWPPGRPWPGTWGCSATGRR